eukprot:gene10119-7084_t
MLCELLCFEVLFIRLTEKFLLIFLSFFSLTDSSSFFFHPLILDHIKNQCSVEVTLLQLFKVYYWHVFEMLMATYFLRIVLCCSG